jgi:hypothetical protein
MRTQFVFYYILYRVGVVHLHQVFLFSMQCALLLLYSLAGVDGHLGWIWAVNVLLFFQVCVCCAKPLAGQRPSSRDGYFLFWTNDIFIFPSAQTAKDDGMNYALMYFFLGEGLLFSVSLFSEYNPRNELQLNEDVHGEIRSQERIYVCGQSDRAGQYIRKSKRRSSWLELEIHQRTLKNILRQGYKSRWGRAKQRGEIEKGFIPFSFPYIYITSEKKTTQ